MVRLLVCSVYNMSLMSLQDYNNLKLEYVLEIGNTQFLVNLYCKILTKIV